MAATTIKDGYNGGSDNQLKVNPDGSINVNGGGGGGSNASVGPTGQPAPSSATEVAGVDGSGNLTPLKVESDGTLHVTGSSVVTGTVSTNLLGLANLQTTQMTVSTSAVNLTPSPLAGRSSLTVKVTCTGGEAIYIGNSNAVTTSTGFPLFNGDALQLDLNDTQNLYAIGSAPGQLAYILEIG
jgi:hypothetical protein